MKFSKTHTDLHGNSIETVSIELNQDAYLDDVLEAFNRFLRAVGYHFDGNIEIVPEESFDPYDKSFDAWDEDSPVEEVSESTAPTDWPFPLTPNP